MKSLKASLLTVTILLAGLVVQLHGWTRTYGLENTNEYAWCVRPTVDGAYIVSGTAFHPYRSCWLLKIDRQGDTLWTKEFEGTGRFVHQTSEGGFIIAGNRYIGEPNEGHDDFLVCKTDEDGDSLWAKTYGSDSSDYAHCVKQTFDGNFILVGALNYTPSTVKNSSLWLLKLNSWGDTLWSRTYSYPDKQSLGWCVCQTADSGYIISGCVSDDDGRHVWLLKTDAQGDTLWTRKYGNSTLDGGHCVQLTSDGGYIIVGDIRNDYTDIWLLKTDSLGDTLWTRTYATEGYDIGYWVEQTSDRGYVISGLKDWRNHQGDIWLLKTDEDGDTLWTREFGGEWSDYGHSVCLAHDGGYLIAGAKDYTSPSGTDVWLLKTNYYGDTVWFEVSPTVILHPEEGRTIHRTIPQAWFKNTGTMIAQDFYCHCEISASSFHTPDYHASYWISCPVELGDSVLVKFPEWVCDDYDSYSARFYTTCEAEPWWSCRDTSIAFTGSATGVEENPTGQSPAWEILNSCGRLIKLRYQNFPAGFHAVIFDASGRKVDELRSHCPQGTLTWGNGMSTGVYFIKSLSADLTIIRKVVLTR